MKLFVVAALFVSISLLHSVNGDQFRCAGDNGATVFGAPGTGSTVRVLNADERVTWKDGTSRSSFQGRSYVYVATVSGSGWVHDQSLRVCKRIPKVLFSCCYPRVSSWAFEQWTPYIESATATAGIASAARVAMFLAQTGHETDGYNTFVEYTNADGTNPWCGNYDGGCRYRGRGAMQLSHKYNYAAFGASVGMDFVANPDLVATPQFAFSSADWFWRQKNLNACADGWDLNTCTRRINGGLNGIEDRRNRLNRAKECIQTYSNYGVPL